jgi:hypothetical protein
VVLREPNARLPPHRAIVLEARDLGAAWSNRADPAVRHLGLAHDRCRQSPPLFRVGARSAVPTALVCPVKADCPTCKMAADPGATTNVRSSIGLDDDDPAGLARCALPEIECV